MNTDKTGNEEAGKAGRGQARLIAISFPGFLVSLFAFIRVHLWLIRFLRSGGFRRQAHAVEVDGWVVGDESAADVAVVAPFEQHRTRDDQDDHHKETDDVDEDGATVVTGGGNGDG